MATGSTRSVRPSRSERGLSSIFRKAVPAAKEKDEVDDDWASDDLIFNEFPNGPRRPFTRSSSFPTQQRFSAIPGSPVTVAASRAAERAAHVEYAPHPGAMSDLWPSLDEFAPHGTRTPNAKKRASTLPTPTAMAPGMSGPSPYDKGAAALAQFQAGQAVPNVPRAPSALPSPRQSMMPAARQSMVPSPLQSSVVPLPTPQTPPSKQPPTFANGSVPTTASQTFATTSAPTIAASQSFSSGWDMKASRRAPPPPLRLPVPAAPRRTVSGPAPATEQRKAFTLHHSTSLPTVCLIPPDDEPSDGPITLYPRKSQEYNKAMATSHTLRDPHSPPSASTRSQTEPVPTSTVAEPPATINPSPMSRTPASASVATPPLPQTREQPATRAPEPQQLSTSIDSDTARFSTFSAEWEQTVGDLPETALYDAIVDGKPDAWVAFQSDSPTAPVFPGNASPPTTNASTPPVVASTPTPPPPATRTPAVASDSSQSTLVLDQNASVAVPKTQVPLANSVPSVEILAQQPESSTNNATRDPTSVTSTARNSVIGELDQAFRLGGEPKLQGPPGMTIGETAAIAATTVAAAGAATAAATSSRQQPKPTRPALRNISASETAPASDNKAEKKKHRRSLSLSSLFSRSKPNFEELPAVPKIEPQHVKAVSTDKAKATKTASKRFSMKDLFAASQADPSTGKKVRRSQSKPDLRSGKHFDHKDAPPVPAIPDGVSNYVPDALAALTKNAGTAPAASPSTPPRADKASASATTEKVTKQDKRKSHNRSSSLGLGKRMSIGNLFKKSREQDENIPAVPSVPEAWARPPAPAGIRPSQSVTDLRATLSQPMPTPSPLATKRSTMAVAPGPGIASTMPSGPAKPVSAATAYALANLQTKPSNPFPTPTMQMPTPTINKRATVSTVPLSDGNRQKTMTGTGKPYPVQTRIRPPSVDGLLNKATMSPTTEKPPATPTAPAVVAVNRPQTPTKGPLRIVNPSSPSSEGGSLADHHFDQPLPPKVPIAPVTAHVAAPAAERPVLKVETSAPVVEKPVSTPAKPAVDQNAWITSRPPPKDTNSKPPVKTLAKAAVTDVVTPRTSSLPSSVDENHTGSRVASGATGAAALVTAATVGTVAIAAGKSDTAPSAAAVDSAKAAPASDTTSITAPPPAQDATSSQPTSNTDGGLAHLAFAAAFDPPESAFKAPPASTKRLSSRTVGLGLLGSITNVKSDPSVKQPVIAAYTKEQQQQNNTSKSASALTPKGYVSPLPSPLSELPPVAEAPVSEEPALEAPSSTVPKAAGGLGRVNRNSTIPAALAATAARRRSESPASPCLISPPLPTGSTIGSPGMVTTATIATIATAAAVATKTSLPTSASSSSLTSDPPTPMVPLPRVSQDDLTTITMQKTTSPVSVKRISLPTVPGGWPMSPPTHAGSVDSSGSSAFYTPMEERSDPFPNPPYAHSNTSSAYMHSSASSRAESPLGLGLDNLTQQTEEVVVDSNESTPRAATTYIAPRPDSGITSAFAGFARREVGTVPLGVSVNRGAGTTAVLHNPVVRHSTPTLLEDASNRVSVGPDLALWAAATGNEHEVLRSSSPEMLIPDDSTGESHNTTTPESVSSHGTNTDDGDGAPSTPRTPELSTLPHGVAPATPSPGSFPAATVTVSDTPSKYTATRRPSRGPFRPAHYDMSMTDDDESFDTAHEGLA